MKRSAYPTLSEINVTNFIDVVLVLLIIFMLTAPFLQEGVEIKLPEAEAKPIPAENGLVVSVFPDSSILVDDRAVKLKDLEAHLRLVHPPGSKAPVFLRGDAGVPYGYIVKLMSTMNAAGLTDVGLVTEPIPKEETARAR